MGYKNTQPKPGVQVSKSNNRVNRTGRSDGTGGKLAGSGKDQTSDHYQHSKSSYSGKRGGSGNPGKDIRRGYVLNEGAGGAGGVKDSTVADDGTKRVRKL